MRGMGAGDKGASSFDERLRGDASNEVIELNFAEAGSSSAVRALRRWATFWEAEACAGGILLDSSALDYFLGASSSLSSSRVAAADALPPPPPFSSAVTEQRLAQSRNSNVKLQMRERYDLAEKLNREIADLQRDLDQKAAQALSAARSAFDLGKGPVVVNRTPVDQPPPPSFAEDLLTAQREAKKVKVREVQAQVNEEADMEVRSLSPFLSVSSCSSFRPNLDDACAEAARDGVRGLYRQGQAAPDQAGVGHQVRQGASYLSLSPSSASVSARGGLRPGP